MNTNHTPGPWTYDITWALIIGPHDEEICAVHAGTEPNERRVDRKQAQANARLIAAAPHLLYNLAIVTERLAAWMTIADSDDVSDDDRQALLDARDAIAAVGTGKARPTFADNFGAVLRDRDELRAALCRLVEWVDAGCDPSEKSMDAARAALINAGGDN